MLNHLTKALQDIELVITGLRESLGIGRAIEGLLTLDLISDACKIRVRILNLIEAAKVDGYDD